VDIWDETRGEPVQSFEWGQDTVTSLRFNKSEGSLLAGTATDRSIVLYDLRLASPLTRVVLAMRSNAVCWNPLESYYFTAANEDHHLYTFDMRKLQTAQYVFKGHVSAVLDLDYSPTGKELVTGAYDRTMRIFDVKSGRSRDIYHTRRMQK
jgi:WD repeat and SOF domain-containing protein 1